MKTARQNKLNCCLLSLFVALTLCVATSQAEKVKCPDIELTGIEHKSDLSSDEGVSLSKQPYIFNFQWEYTNSDSRSTVLKIIRRRFGFPDSVQRFKYDDFVSLDFKGFPTKISVKKDNDSFIFTKSTTSGSKLWAVDVSFNVSPNSSMKTYDFRYVGDLECSVTTE